MIYLEIRNPTSKRFTFHQNNVSVITFQRRLDYFLISNVLQETLRRADVSGSFCSDHSPIVFTISFESNNTREKSVWKFNGSLLSTDDYINNLRNHISQSLSILDQKGMRGDQIKWKFIKFKN